MDQEMNPPLDYFRIQKNSKADETMPVEFTALIHNYDAVRQGLITDAETIRTIARQFEAIADMPEASEIFPYKADRLAAALYSQALEIDMRAKTRNSGQVNITEHFFPKSTDEITIDFVKISEEILYKLGVDDKNTPFLDQAQARESGRQTQERIQENHGKPTIIGHDSAKRPEINSVTQENINASPERLIDLASISDQWAALLKFIEIAEQEEKELTEKGIVKGPIDHDDLWKE